MFYLKDPNKKHSTSLLLWIFLALPIAWFAAVLENCLQANLTLDSLMQNFTYLLSHPFSIAWTTRTAAFILAAVLCYALAVAVYESERQNTRIDEEHGSASWGNVKTIRKLYANRKDPNDGIILTKNIRISFDTHKHRRNLNTLVIGGSGAGKSRGFALPGILNANCSCLIVDPKSELLRATGKVWSCLVEVIFNMIVLVGLVKGSDRIVKEMLDL